MVKGSYPVPNAHFRKHWNNTGSQKGHIKSFFQQAPQKKQRRLRRAAKAKKLFPRPVSQLRPLVRCNSQRYNMRIRAGRGFNLDELKKAGVSPSYARTIGISVDHRRKNHSQEGLDRNVQRLKEYLANLVVWPKGQKAEGTVTQNTDKFLGQTPNEASRHEDEAPRALTADEKKRKVYMFMRKVLRDQKWSGIREQRKQRKEEAKKTKAK
eukprot:NODE_1661_length_778_cov_295.711214_g1612_i0.p1 GENE.NODE_1661_length_778_cov_295.711214_g1612_i0~~NODE_1661_length_778_cov_295.711214_g1612_i0.p1  ORF type:complete len:210 (-),score=56.00 NODE_1661_length_778_cov_295.711214_g1612_i0:92-721(-)